MIGYGRSILEGMACGRAAYVYDWNGGEGWVTPKSFRRIEADGFAGRSGETVLDGDRIRKDLRKYTRTMGPVNHDLVLAYHRANVHAQEMIGLLSELGSPGAAPDPEPLREMARLVRLEWRARVEAQNLASENAILHDHLARSERRLGEAQQAAAAEAKKGEKLARTYEGTLSWRLTAPLRALRDLLRRLRRRSAP